MALVLLIFMPFVYAYTPADADDSRERPIGWAISLLGLGLLVIVIVLGSINYEGHEGEPFDLIQGVSLWPTEALRFVAALLGLYFILKVYADLKANDKTLAEEFHLEAPTGAPGLSDWVASTKKEFDKSAQSKEASQDLSYRFRRLKFVYRQSTIRHWEDSHSPVNAAQLWRDYLKRGWGTLRVVRSLTSTILFSFFLFYVLLSHISEWPNVPYRGDFSLWVHWILYWFSVPVLIFLVFFVADATWLCKHFTDYLAKGPTLWPNALLKKHEQLRGMPAEFLRDWLDIRMIAQRTKMVGKLIYYPSIILAIMIVARLRLFDNWDSPVGVLISYGLGFVYVGMCAIMLSTAAERARMLAVNNLKDKLLRVRGAGPQETHIAEQIDLTIKEIESEREGAFTPWTQHPVLKAILFPSGGFGLVALLEYLATKL